ncbi:hypothetical protein D3C85_1855900 [compost metagenome]
MGKVDYGLNRSLEQQIFHFIKQQGQNDGYRKGKQKLVQIDNQRVADDVVEVLIVK